MYYTRSQKRKLTINIVAWAALVLFIAIMGAAVLMVRAPELVFTNIHWGWTLAIGIASSIAAIAFAVIILYNNFSFHCGASLILVGVCILVLCICGISLAAEQVYEISEARELNLLNNLPDNNDKAYHIEIVNDLDFDGVDVPESYGDFDKTFIINGNGHAIMNLKYEASLTEDTELFVMGRIYKGGVSQKYISSQIKNLRFVDCEFRLTPNAYDDDERIGEACSFSIFTQKSYDGSAYLVRDNVDIRRTTVRIMTAEEKPGYMTPSSIGNIYPANTTEGSSQVDMKIVREGR